jgi:hypothetical protein
MRIACTMLAGGTLLMFQAAALAQGPAACPAPEPAGAAQSVVAACSFSGCEDYFHSVAATVRQRWEAGLAQSKRRPKQPIQIRIFVRRDGSPEIEYLLKSKDEKADRLAGDVLLGAAPFPPFPAAWTVTEAQGCFTFYLPAKK